MISKELLSEVLGRYVSKVDSFIRMREFGPCISYSDDRYSYDINIHELAHKCKEWAIKQNYIVESEYEGIKLDGIPYAIVRVFFDGDVVFNNYSGKYIVENHTEPEAIFKACQWILENK